MFLVDDIEPLNIPSFFTPVYKVHISFIKFSVIVLA